MLTPPPAFTGLDTHLAATVFGIDADVFAGWGQWAGAIGSFAAVIVALRLARRDGKLRDRERQDQEVAQARLITATVELVERRAPRTTARGTTEHTYVEPGLIVANHSAEPVSNIQIEKLVPSLEGHEVTEWNVDLIFTPNSSKLPCYVADVIRPGDRSTTMAITYPKDPGSPSADGPEPTGALVTFTFVDGRGSRWRRTGTSTPERLLDRAPTRSWFGSRRKREVTPDLDSATG